MKQGINLLPDEMQTGGGKNVSLRRVTIVSLSMLFLIAVILVATFLYYENIRETWLVVENEMNSLASEISSNDSRIREGKLRVIKEKIQVLAEHFSSDPEYSAFLIGIFERIPVGIDMISFDGTGARQEFIFVGKADSVTQIDTFIEGLKEWNSVRSPSLQEYEHRVEKGFIYFKIKLTKIV